jgi:glutaredoxin 3
LKVEIYTKNNCIWCDRAKLLLDSKNIQFKEIDLSDDQKREKFYNSIGENVKTVPQIYIDDLRIGGYQDLVAWFNG